MKYFHLCFCLPSAWMVEIKSLTQSSDFISLGLRNKTPIPLKYPNHTGLGPTCQIKRKLRLFLGFPPKILVRVTGVEWAFILIGPCLSCLLPPSRRGHQCRSLGAEEALTCLAFTLVERVASSEVQVLVRKSPDGHRFIFISTLFLYSFLFSYR